MPAPRATSVAWSTTAKAAPAGAETPNDAASTPATAIWNTPTFPGISGNRPMANAFI